jgi:formate hydrogenlyase subunit 6/NADH:ubiquinone oxidoreductase subunit I
MLKLLYYLLSQGVATATETFPALAEGVRGLPSLTPANCNAPNCNLCSELCPTDAISLKITGDKAPVAVSLDLGSCIACGACVQNCPRSLSEKPTQNVLRCSESLVSNALKILL